MFQRNNTNFKRSEDFSGFKYKVDLLQNDDPDHKTLRDALGLGSAIVSSAGLPNVVGFQIYRVKAFGDESSNQKLLMIKIFCFFMELMCRKWKDF